MLSLPDALAALPAADLYASLDDLRAHKSAHGRGRSPEAAYVRDFCKGEMTRVRREIRRRGLPAQRPQANVWVQPAQAREPTDA